MPEKLEKKLEELRQKQRNLEIYGRIRENLVSRMQWDTMNCHEPDEEHEETWFTEPDEDNWRRDEYEFYTNMIAVLDKEYIK